MSVSAVPGAHANRQPPMMPPSSEIVSGQVNVIGFSGGQNWPRASAAAFIPA
jgi:hypothetical protein